MNKTHRKGLTAVVAVLAAFALSACSGGAQSSGGGGSAGSGPVTVTFWQQQFEDYQQTWFKKYVDQFNASQTDVKVDYQVVPADTWQQKLQAAQAAGTQPDIATTSYGNIKPGVAQGMFAPLNNYMPASAFSDIKSNIQPFVSEGGQYYGYPLLVEPSTVFYYRTDLVQAAGLDPNSPPKSWSDFINWATKLTSGDVEGTTIASVAADLGWSSWGLQYNSCKQWPITDDWSASRVTDPCMADVVNFYTTLFQNQLIPQTPTVGYTDATPYCNGEVASMVNGSWALGQIKSSCPDLLAKTAVAPMATKDGGSGETTATLGGWTLTLDAKSKNPQQAADFINYLVAGDPNIMADFFKTSGYSKYTARTSVDAAILAADPNAQSDPYMQIISKDIVAYGVAEPVYPWDISLAVGTAIEGSMKGTDTVDNSLATADQSINQTISTQQLAGTAPKS